MDRNQLRLPSIPSLKIKKRTDSVSICIWLTSWKKRSILLGLWFIHSRTRRKSLSILQDEELIRMFLSIYLSTVRTGGRCAEATCECDRKAAACFAKYMINTKLEGNRLRKHRHRTKKPSKVYWNVLRICHPSSFVALFRTITAWS